VRDNVPMLDTDRYLAPDIERMIALVRSGAFAEIYADISAA
jgi:histidine ammonia-lyase